jgi:predicted O-methyltransferase YrrM
MIQAHSIPSLSKLKVPAEQYQSENCFNDFPDGQTIYYMHETERKFIHGLIRFFKPRRILEMGVAHGGGTAVLLNAIKDFKYGEVVSIDLNASKEVGCFAKKVFPKSKNWKLFTGKDPCEVIYKIGQRAFDFCVIDTAHIHPIESLNFLTAFPFLSENAVVVIHDLIWFMGCSKAYPQTIPLSTRFANRLLFDGLCGAKLKVKDEKYLGSTSGNIGAVQITKDTKKYIQDIFSMLMLPWGLLPSYKHLNLISNIIKKHYSEENFREFCNAVNVNLNFIENDYSYWNKLKNAEEIIKLLKCKNIIFYGAGRNCENWLDTLKEIKPNEIWDMNPNIKNIQGITVKRPDFTPKKKYKNSIIVITVLNRAVANEIKKKLKKCNFSKIYISEEFFVKKTINRTKLSFLKTMCRR